MENVVIENIVTWAILVVGLGGNYTYIKQRLDIIEDKMDKADERYHDCREELPLKYAKTKDVNMLFDRIRENENDLCYMKGKSNGVVKQAAGGGK